MTAPTVVDLSLPADQELMAAASPSPEAETARVTRGDPGQISGLGRQLQSAGSDLDGIYALSVRTQRALAGSFTNDGAPVYDEQVHRQLLPRGFQDAGTQLHDVGRRLGAVAEELSSVIGAVNVALDGLRSDLQRLRAGLAAEVDAARGAGGLIPVAAVAALQERRAAVAREMQELVDTCGRVVAGRVARYNEVLGGCLPVIGELGRTVGVGPDRLGGAVDTSGTRINSVLGGRLEASSPAPPLPTVEIFPTPESRPPDRGFTPAPTGPGPLITLPAPDLGAAVQDGPGSGQRTSGPGIRIDYNGRGEDSDTGARPPPEPTIHTGQQGKHVPGHPNFSPERSRIMVDPKDLLEYVGQGEPVGSIPRGQLGFRERVDFGRPIGEYVDRDGHAWSTSIGVIHHRRDGSVHIVPGRPQ
jgi:Bacterial toxin 50